MLEGNIPLLQLLYRRVEDASVTRRTKEDKTSAVPTKKQSTGKKYLLKRGGGSNFCTWEKIALTCRGSFEYENRRRYLRWRHASCDSKPTLQTNLRRERTTNERRVMNLALLYTRTPPKTRTKKTAPLWIEVVSAVARTHAEPSP